MANTEKRFKRIFSLGRIRSIEILLDTKTGVNYLFTTSGNAGGLTPLLDEKGQTVITPQQEIEYLLRER